jgi:hypothetical protein
VTDYDGSEFGVERGDDIAHEVHRYKGAPDRGALLPGFRPMLAYAARVPVPPSMSSAESRRVAPACVDSIVNSSIEPRNRRASSLSNAARTAKVSDRRSGSPTLRA